MTVEVDTIEPAVETAVPEAVEAARDDSAGFFFISSMLGNLLEAEWVDQDKLDGALTDIGAAIDKFLVELNNAMDKIGGGQSRMGNENLAPDSEVAVNFDPGTGEPVVESTVDPVAPAAEQQMAVDTTAPNPMNMMA